MAVGMWEGLTSSIADELFEMAGHLVVRTTAPYVSGDTTITVESTDRFPSSGTIAFGGVVAAYASKTPTTFDTLTDPAGDPGVDADLTSGAVVLDRSRKLSQLDDLRASFIVPTAEDEELDILSRNYGLFRPRGLDDDSFIPLLQALIYGEAQTIYLCEQVLDALVGAGLYTIYEDLESFPHTVFVIFPISGSADVFEGKAILSGGEPQTRDTTTTVTVDNPVTVVYGVYLNTDVSRTGQNYAFLDITASTSAGSPTELASVAAFLASDDGKAVILDDLETWTATFLSTSALDLDRGPFSDGRTDGGDNERFTSTQRRFAPWMVGHKLVITSGVNAGTYDIDNYLNPGAIESAGAGFATDSSVTWRLIPDFANAAGRSAKISRATFAGAVVATPVTMPTDVIVDYATVPSAQALDDFSFNGDDQYPFYLWDEGFFIQTVLDLITAAGVRVVLIPE